jgi:hypothetical protein
MPKTWIVVANRKEGDQIRAGLADPQVRAFVKVIGTLSALASDRARERVLRFVANSLDEETQRRKEQGDAAF